MRGQFVGDFIYIYVYNLNKIVMENAGYITCAQQRRHYIPIMQALLNEHKPEPVCKINVLFYKYNFNQIMLSYLKTPRFGIYYRDVWSKKVDTTGTIIDVSGHTHNMFFFFRNQ